MAWVSTLAPSLISSVSSTHSVEEENQIHKLEFDFYMHTRQVQAHEFLKGYKIQSILTFYCELIFLQENFAILLLK